jgi:nicotinate phosphoribosyltransferase
VGTHLITSSDHPALGGVYKLVAIKAGDGEWKPRIKLSSNPMKMTDPGCKRVTRYHDQDGRYLADIIRLAAESRAADVCDGAGGTPGGPQPILFADRHDSSYLRGVRDAAGCEQLLQTVMTDGVRVDTRPSLEEMRTRARCQIGALPEETRRLRTPEIYTVGLSPDLTEQKVRLAAGAPGVLAPGPSAAGRPA